MRKASPSTLLENVSLFSACSKKELAAIAKASDQLSLPEGHVLMKQGETAREAFVIISGQATVTRNDRKVATLGPGDTVGELGLLDMGERTATVVADETMDVLVIGPREFRALLDEVPSLTKKLLTTLAATVRDLDEKSYG